MFNFGRLGCMRGAGRLTGNAMGVASKRRGLSLLALIACLPGCSTIVPDLSRAEITQSHFVPFGRVQWKPNGVSPTSPPDNRTEPTTNQVQIVSALDEPSRTAAPAEAFAADAELTVEKIVNEVMARNPTITQMTAAASAAASKYPQVTSLDDPILGGAIGPASIGSRSVDFAYRIEVSQRLPYPGKRALRGENAQAEARAATDDIELPVR